jgi:LuxR family transcriptional regulator, quorum-sensing system regulator SdiA
MNYQASLNLLASPFDGLQTEDSIWQRMMTVVAEGYGITSLLYAFTHSRYTASRTGFTSSLFMRHNLPEDFLASYPNGLSLDDDIASELVIGGCTEMLWSDFDALPLRPVQRARRERDKQLGMGVGITFGMRFGGSSGFGGMCWAKRHGDADEFKAMWEANRVEMLTLAHQFETSLRPAMVKARFQLTPREAEVMSYSAGGMTAKQIAEHLELSPKTISNTLERARKTMEAVSTMEAVAKALIYELIG